MNKKKWLLIAIFIFILYIIFAFINNNLDVTEANHKITFESHHEVFKSAIVMYAVDHENMPPQNMEDLKPYITDGYYYKNPMGATYTIRLDDNGNCILTSTYEDEILTFQLDNQKNVTKSK